jgi:uncharacterized protein (TIGR02145 family)
LPTDAEWAAWVNYVGSSTAGRKLKSKSPDWNGTDDYGFSALPGGHIFLGDYDDIGSVGVWWTATKYDTSSDNAYAWRMETAYADVIRFAPSSSCYWFSVRCVKN